MLSLKFGRLVRTSLAGGSLALSGCVDRAYDFGGPESIDPDPDPDTDPPGTPPAPTSDPNPDPPPPLPPSTPGPPQLIDAQLVDPSTLELTFTEGIASTQAVDPRQFRMSAAFGIQDKYNSGTAYFEVSNLFGEYCYEDDKYCYECPEDCGPLVVAGITQAAERPEVLLLSFDPPIPDDTCAQIDSAPSEFFGSLFIHYSSSGAAPVTDNDGELLPSLAEHWVLEPDQNSTYVEGFFPEMSPMLPIECSSS